MSAHTRRNFRATHRAHEIIHLCGILAAATRNKNGYNCSKCAKKACLGVSRGVTVLPGTGVTRSVSRGLAPGPSRGLQGPPGASRGLGGVWRGFSKPRRLFRDLILGFGVFPSKKNQCTLYIFGPLGWLEAGLCLPMYRKSPEGLYTSTLHRLLPLSYPVRG